MLNIAFVSNIDGIDAAFYRVSSSLEADEKETSIIYSKERCILNSSHITLPANARGRIAVVRRELFQKRVLTWIAIFEAAPARYNNLRPQSGSFFYGCGVWLNDQVIDGNYIETLLTQSIGNMKQSLAAEARPENWNIHRSADRWLSQIEKLVDKSIQYEEVLGPLQGLSFYEDLYRCCIDITQNDQANGFADSFNSLQKMKGSYQKYNCAYISNDPQIILKMRERGQCDLFEDTVLVYETSSSIVKPSKVFDSPVDDASPLDGDAAPARATRLITAHQAGTVSQQAELNMKESLQGIEKDIASVRTEIDQFALKAKASYRYGFIAAMALYSTSILLGCGFIIYEFEKLVSDIDNKFGLILDRVKTEWMLNSTSTFPLPQVSAPEPPIQRDPPGHAPPDAPLAESPLQSKADAPRPVTVQTDEKKRVQDLREEAKRLWKRFIERADKFLSSSKAGSPEAIAIEMTLDRIMDVLKEDSGTARKGQDDLGEAIKSDTFEMKVNPKKKPSQKKAKGQ